MRFSNYIRVNNKSCLPMHEVIREYGEPRSRKISRDEAVEFLKGKGNKAWKAWKSETARIYRGIPSDDKFRITDPRKGELRKSANIRNYMTLLMDNLDSWKGYPKRSRSLICSTDPDKASRYSRSGFLYGVFPEDECKIGICSKGDVWDSFKFGESSYMNSGVYYFNQDLAELFDKVGINLVKSERSWKDFIRALNILDVDLDKDFLERSYVNLDVFWSKYLRVSVDLDKYLELELDPKRNGFKLVKVGRKLPVDNEVWVGHGECLMVQLDNEDKVNFNE